MRTLGLYAGHRHAQSKGGVIRKRRELVNQMKAGVLLREVIHRGDIGQPLESHLADLAGCIEQLVPLDQQSRLAPELNAARR